MKIAHISDLHLLDLRGAMPGRMFNKRITGYANLRFKRHAIHRPEALFRTLAAVKSSGVDHVVITGDVSNLALEREFELVRGALAEHLGFGHDRVSIVPGNHDAYTRGAYVSGRFARYFAPFLKSDISTSDSDEVFPYVKLRGPVAIIGLSSALNRPPLMASGAFGGAQLDRLEKLLAHPEVTRRTPVVLMHHPPRNPPTLLKTFFEGLWDARRFASMMSSHAEGLVLHGHLHRRVRTKLGASGWNAVGATSASLVDDRPERMAGFNRYEIDTSGHISEVTSYRILGNEFVETAIPERMA